jgi:hypothetical protein
MTVADLIVLLQQCGTPTLTPVRVRVFETNAAGEDPVFDKCEIREVTESRGVVIMDAEET